MTFHVNKNSWHYKLLIFNSTGYNDHATNDILERGKTIQQAFDMWKYPPTNFCSYWRRAVIWPSITIIFNIAYWCFIISILSLVSFTTVWAIGTIAIICVMALFAFFLVYLLRMASTKVLTSTNQNIVKTAYTSYKKNLCPDVKYDGDK